jgi:hypothetical protein
LNFDLIVERAKPSMVVYKNAFFVVCIGGICALTVPSEVSAQAQLELIPTAEIPHSYKSWSLFLVCNPAWIIQNGDKGIGELFFRYRAFGHAIGPNNLAIWFWKARAEIPTAGNTDIGRSGVYCKRYKLPPSESPHVLVTTKHPDEKNPGDRLVVSLNGLDAHDSALALDKLADQLVGMGLNRSGLDAPGRWQQLLAAVGSAAGATGCYFNKVSFSFKTVLVNAEIGHATNNGC